MVTKKSSMYSYLHGSPGKGGRYWDGTMGADDTPDREDYAHHLRSSSYHMLHSRQLSALSSGSAGSYHSRQHSNTSNYSEPDDLSPRADTASAHGHHRMDGGRYFSYDNLGPEPPSNKYHGSWNISEPDLTMGPPPYSPPGSNYQQMPAPLSPTQTSSVPPSLPSVRHSPTSSSSGRHPSSPPPPPVRDASSLKYVRYGPGHEKYPSWPVAAGAVNQVLPPGTASNDANVSGLPETNTLLPNQQGSTRSKSWTEQSWTEQSGEYPKDKSVVYARPHNKKQISPYYQQQLKTVMERCEKIPKEMYECNLTDDVISPSDPYIDSYFKGAPNHYPPYDREGRPLTDKDYSIPSPPERDIGMCDLNIGQLTAAQLAEYQYQYGYADLIPGTTPLLDQLRRESDIWDGRSEHDSGQGSESLADSARYSNGRESVTTVVTNSSSASSSETLKWHGSMSDISTFSGHSRDPRSDHNVVHSSRVQTPQRHNSESVLYYTTDSRGRPSRSRGEFDSRGHRERNLRSSIRDTESGLPRAINEAKYSREVERNNEMNNLKKFPSYSYTQPLSQISETPIAETHEAVKTVRSSNTRSPQSPTVDISKPPSVAERIHELERNSRSGANDSVVSLRDQSESCEREQLRSSEDISNTEVNETSEQHERNDSGVYVRDKCDISEPRGERRNSGGHKREHSRDTSETRGERRDSGGYNREHIRDTSETRSERRDSGGYKREHVRDVSETRGERRDSGGYLREHRDLSENRSERRDSRGSVRELRDSSENRSERRDSRGSSMREQRDLMENRSDRRGSIREHRDSNENRDLSRTHLRRGSRESMRETRPDYLKFETMHGENIRSPNSNGSARSPGHKESETSRPYSHENFQNMMNDYTEVDRRESNGSGVSYSYLDPEKKCKVSESTLKSIQKQAVMSFFYERNSAKSVSGASFSDLSSASSQTSLHSADSSRSGSSHTASNSGVIPVLRSDRSVRSVKGVARLGRVPEGEAGDDEANRPVRRPSITARDLINENIIEESKASTSQRASETPPALPQKNSQQTLECVRVSTNPSSVPHTTSSNEDGKEEQESSNQEDGSRSQSSRGHQESHAHTTALPTPTPPTVVQAHPTAQDSHSDTTQLQPPSHKDDAPPRPPERPPKKPTLRSLFHGPNPEGGAAPLPVPTGAGGSATVPTTSTQSPPAAGAHSPDKHSPDSDMRRIEESANELRNLSPQRPYYYRKPPAPDPPRSPDTAATAVATPPSPAQHQPSVNTSSPSHHSNNNTTHDGVVHLSAPNSSLAISRSSTPDLPPPPPPPVTDEEVVLCDEPLPPPPTAAEVLPGGIMLEMPPPPLPPPPEDTALLEEQHHLQQQQQQQHHMLPPPPPRGDSSKNVVQQARQELPNFMRMRRCSAPFFMSVWNLPDFRTYHKDSYMAHRRDWKTGFEGRYRRTISPSPPENRNLLQHRHDNSNVNNNINNNNNNNGKGGTMPSSNGGGVGGLPPAGVLRAFASTSSLLHANNSKNALMDNDNCINNNGWPAHSRSSSTTVNFTAEELRAFKARRAHAQQENANALENKENAPRQMHTCQSSPALRSLASDGSTTSLATSSINSGRSASPASPSRVSPSQSWRTSLDSLHRPPSSTNSNASSTPLHQREDSGMSTSTEALSLPRSSSINESLSRISAIHDSLSRSTSVADSLGRSLSLTETSSSLSESSVPISETLSSHKSSPIQSAEPSTTTTAARHEPSSPMSPVPHDGPVTAHPATVTEEPLTPTPTPLSTPKSPLSPKTSLSPKPSLSLSPKSAISHSPKSSFSQKSPIPPTSPKSPTSPVSSSSISSPPNTTPSVEASNSFTATTISNISNVSTASSTFSSNTTSTTSAYTFPVTSPCMASMESITSGDRSNIVVLGYGRTPYQEEIDCDQFTKDIATQLTLDNKLQALLVPGPEHKTAADYMNGVFTLELRKDLLSSQHATHPDIAATRTQQTTITTTDQANNNNNNNNNTATHTNGDVCSDASPLPSDSAYFTTSESKAKLLTRLRGSSNIMEAAQPFQDHQQLNKRKEELVKSIGRKLEILRAEQEAIKEEQKLNHELGAEVTTLVVKRASNPQSDKYKLHVEEIDKITSLLLGLSGRLARAENALRTLSSETDPEEKRILESKRDKLSEQLEEAKRLKENIDRRAVQVSKVLNQYLTEDEYADYDHFIKMKAKLIMDAREIDDKIKLGEEQQVALKEMIVSCKKT